LAIRPPAEPVAFELTPAEATIADLPMNIQRPKRQKKPQAALLGLAFDADDGHKRITRGPNFLLAGGSQETHGMLQETAIKINERLNKAGKQLSDVSVNELRDIVADIHR
jgi:hypothetical protein